MKRNNMKLGTKIWLINQILLGIIALVLVYHTQFYFLIAGSIFMGISIFVGMKIK